MGAGANYFETSVLLPRVVKHRSRIEDDLVLIAA